MITIAQYLKSAEHNAHQANLDAQSALTMMSDGDDRMMLANALGNLDVAIARLRDVQRNHGTMKEHK